MYIAFKEFMTGQELSANTISAYITGVRQFFEMYPALNKGALLAYKKWLMGHYAAQTVNVRLRGAIKYAEFAGIPECEEVKSLKVPQRLDLENVITREEFDRLSAGIRRENEKHYWIVQFLAKTGARVSELIVLKRECLRTGYQDVFCKGKLRRVYIPDRLIRDSRVFFGSSPKRGALLFTNHSGEQYTRHGIKGILAHHGPKYGIRPAVLHPHSFRHFFAKQFLERTKDISMLKDILGHANINITAIYLQASGKEKRALLDEVVDW